MDEDSGKGSPGLRDSARGALSSGLGFARMRGELLSIEAEESRQHLRTIFRFATVGLVTFTAGYALLVGLGVAAAGRAWFGGRFEIPAAAAATFHLLLGGVLLVAVRARIRRAKFFKATLEQFDRDRQWLRQLQNDLTSER